MNTIKNPETGKVTAVVTMLKVFGDKINNSRNANPGKLLNKPNKRLNSKKKHLNRALKRPNELNESVSDISKRQIVKQKTIRVLLDTGSMILIFEQSMSTLSLCSNTEATNAQCSYCPLSVIPIAGDSSLNGIPMSDWVEAAVPSRMYA